MAKILSPSAAILQATTHGPEAGIPVPFRAVCRLDVRETIPVEVEPDPDPTPSDPNPGGAC